MNAGDRVEILAAGVWIPGTLLVRLYPSRLWCVRLDRQPTDAHTTEGIWCEANMRAVRPKVSPPHRPSLWSRFRRLFR